jgi:4'-phosphopantetheinyl transferase
VLAEAAGLAPAYWRFVSGPFEKPRIDPATCQPDLRFNISHTRGLAAVAVCLEHEIGVDVEAASRMLSWHEIARLNFAPREIQLLEQMPSEERFRTFLRLWTLKESYIKATGLGLGCRLNSFAFTLDPVQITTDEPGAEIADTWQFFELDPTPNHLLAGAIQQGAGAPLTIQARALAPQDV